MNGLTGKRIVVTGAARGIGAALAAELRARGATAITADVAGDADVTCDVSDAAQVSAMFAEAGDVDGLVNCAALLVGSQGVRRDRRGRVGPHVRRERAGVVPLRRGPPRRPWAIGAGAS